MGDTIKARKGIKASIDHLLLGEFGFTTDEERVYIGGNNGNIPLPNVADLSESMYFTGITVKDKLKPTKGIVTFITDDASAPDYTLYKPLFKSLGVPFCTAVITNNVGNTGKATLSQLLEIQADGNEILSHTHTHPHLSELSDTDCEAEMVNSKAWLIANGFSVETICYPYGFWGEREKALAKKYYRSARCSDYGLNGLNDTPIETFELKAVWLDSTVVISNDPSGFQPNTIDYYKYYIDKAYANNTWLIIGTHSSDVNTNGLAQLLTDVITYAKTKCDILTCKQALDKVGNIVETGSFGKLKPYVEHFAVGYNGKMNSNNLETIFKNTNTFDGTSLPSVFEPYKTTINRITTPVAISSVLPELVGGILSTTILVPKILGLDLMIYNYQTYNVITSGNVYKRVCKSDGTWDIWKEISNNLQVGGNISTSFNQGISNYKKGITTNIIGTADASLTPSGTAGVLITVRIDATSVSQYNFQEFTEYAGYKKYKRYAIDGVTWSAWVKLAIAKSPTEIAITGLNGFASAFGNKAVYMKTQENIVKINCYLKTTTAITGGIILFNLPLGYRTNGVFRAVGLVGTTSTNINRPCLIKIDTNGDVIIDATDGLSYAYIAFNADFVGV